MRIIIMVGAGAVGSSFLHHLSKYTTARGETAKVILCDFDTVEKRNTVSQDFDLRDIGELKAKVLAERFSHDFLEIEAINEKITPDRLDELVKSIDQKSNHLVLVDGVDNWSARRMLWDYAFNSIVPCMHLALSQDGEGEVSWNHLTLNSFNTSFWLMPDDQWKEMLETKSVSLPPCELNKFRFIIQTTGFCATQAIAAHFGWKQFTEDLDALFNKAGIEDCEGIMPCFRIKQSGFNLVDRKTLFITPSEVQEPVSAVPVETEATEETPVEVEVG